MTTPQRLKAITALATAGLALSACGSEPDRTIAKGPDGMPKGDTGWTVSEEDGALRLQRQLDQLTLSYVLKPRGQGMQTTMTAQAKPCLGGKGEQTVSENFEPLDADDASNLSVLRERIDSLVSRVDDTCDLPEDVASDIGNGFDGLYFRTADQRAALAGE